MDLSFIKKIELEITSDCNAACPGCARTQNPSLLKIESFSLADLIRLFPDAQSINGKQFKFCGVLGDPILNSQCAEMIEYLVQHGGFCQISTNGAYQTSKWWHRLGEISAKTQLLEVNFCVDGHKETNHIYRINTNFKVLERNMQAYATGGNYKALATWIYIVFDHNEHELDAAREHASKLGFNFATRTGMRNSLHEWVSLVQKRQNKQLVREEHLITTTGNKEHSKKEAVLNLNKFVEEYDSNTTSPVKKKQIIDSIVCKLIHEGEIFIASNLTLWPCCFLWDSAFKNNNNILEKLSEYPAGWNSLKTSSISQVLLHPWFKEILALSWDLDHPKHLSRCIVTCAYNKAYHNEIRVEKNE
jgi:MoaA/NifB/PqqE/SkfB family radical SAM enzyme